jgi:hypothetical protein
MDPALLAGRYAQEILTATLRVVLLDIEKRPSEVLGVFFFARDFMNNLRRGF